MRMRSVACFFLLMSGQFFYSQLLITEVYYNTPYNEKLYFNKKVMFPGGMERIPLKLKL